MIGFQNYNSGRNKRSGIKVLPLLIFGGFALTAGWAALLVSGVITLGGVPFSVLIKFISDGTALSAYATGNGAKLHDRLDEMGIEGEMKDYYRPRIPDEEALDQHIHQILYDRTRYVGKAYRLNGNGELVLKNPDRLNLDD